MVSIIPKIEMGVIDPASFRIGVTPRELWFMETLSNSWPNFCKFLGLQIIRLKFLLKDMLLRSFSSMTLANGKKGWFINYNAHGILWILSFIPLYIFGVPGNVPCQNLGHICFYDFSPFKLLYQLHPLCVGIYIIYAASLTFLSIWFLLLPQVFGINHLLMGVKNLLC